MDANMVIKQAVDTGDIVIGTRRTEKAVKKKTAKMLVIASNCPEFDWLKDIAVKVHRYKGTSLDLGAACGKPYSVSMLAVLSPGESTIMSL
jgi:large subunit ribosomal protein L30e